MRRFGASVLAVAALAGCHSPQEKQAAPLRVAGPPRTLRVALDPAFADATLRRALDGPFRLVRRTRNRVIVARPGLTVEFRRLDPYAAVRAFRGGELDEAPVPQGEIKALQADRTLGPAVRARSLLGVDVVVFSARVPREVRRACWLTVPRGEYEALIPERVAPAAFGLLEGAEGTSPADVRRARATLADLRPVPVRLAVPNRPELVEAAELPWAEWRQLGLPVRLAPGARRAEARFRRVVAPSERALFAALGARAPGSLAELDERLRREARIVPLARVAEARVVSPRVRGWAMDATGVVDYARVTLAAG